MAKIEAYFNDDYAGLETKTYNFYFGYEVTKCKKHKRCCQDEMKDDDSCDDSEWCFSVTTKKGKRLMTVSVSEMEKNVKNFKGGQPVEYLLVGIGLFFK